ncbi:hypothetical protein [Salimicrobium halophilum]|uniref:Lipoprotein n=1 Tax=Salimicrobium halophilum TaxID=86666 RepID=A0A1G8R9K9_9BACI|nr:hypothetical protein [Salimicrobium halophilum]SDJ13543.1 hypothetical protein SAMN04490247_0903 [Salimicrobium halophilum]
MKTYITALLISILFLSGCSSEFTKSFEKKGDMESLVVQKVVNGETSSSRAKTVTDPDTIAEILQKGEGLGAKTITGEEAEGKKTAASSYYTFRSYSTSETPVYSIVVLEDGTFLVEGTKKDSGIMMTTDTHEILLDDMKQLADVNF